MDFKSAVLPTPDAFHGSSCFECMSSAPNLLTCSACKRAKYCNQQCQMKNWKKEHKLVCKALKCFHDEQPGYLEQAHWRNSIQGLQSFKQDFQTFKKNYDKTLTPKMWKITEDFICSTRICPICKKTEYDTRVPKSAWVNCKKCKFGWCCSKEHWSEYESKHHTKELCDMYKKSITISHFRYQHMINHNEDFQFSPENVVHSSPIECFPCDWEEYFRIRAPNEYSLKDRLPEEFFTAATYSLSQPLSCLYGMYQHDQKFFTAAKKLTIHVVGASPAYELVGNGPSCVWEEILHFLPNLQKLSLVFVGPETGNTFQEISAETCPDCAEKNRERMISYYEGTYHDFYESDQFSKPDFIIAFNTGMYEEYTESWKTSLRIILDLDVPCLFTSYNNHEATADLNVLRDLDAKTLTEECSKNPFGVDFPLIDPGMADGFFRINMYHVCFKGHD